LRIFFWNILIGKHATQLRLIGGIGNYAVTQFPLAGTRLRRQNMTGVRVMPNYFARTRLFEALGRAPMCLHFGHKLNVLEFVGNRKIT
jgi:hypothetical protein